MQKWFYVITFYVLQLTTYESSQAFLFNQIIGKSKIFDSLQNRQSHLAQNPNLGGLSSFIIINIRKNECLKSKDNGIVEDISEDKSLIRHIAADALFKIFFRLESKKQHDDERLQVKISRNGVAIDTEKALKKSLRLLQSHLEQNESNEYYRKNTNYRSIMRQRLSEIVLGISVMRMKYWFLVIKGKRDPNERYILLQNPIIGTEQLADLVLMNKIQLERNESFLFSLQEKDLIQNKKNADKFIHTLLMRMIHEMIDIHEIQNKQTKNKQNHPNNLKYTFSSLGIHSVTDLLPNEVKAIQLSIEESLPLFLSDIFISQYGFTDACKLAQISNKPGPITLRRNPLQSSSNYQLSLRLLQENSIVTNPITINTHLTDTSTLEDGKLHCIKNYQSISTDTKYALRIQSQRPKSIWNIQAWKDGQFEVQDLGSQLIVQAMELENLFTTKFNNGTTSNIYEEANETYDHVTNKIIVDYCAGNGGKTLAMACIIAAQSQSQSQSQNKFKFRTHIFAHDINPDRLKQIIGSLDRVGLKNQMCNNNTSVMIETTTNATNDIPSNFADIVLVDAPCSSVGVLRRRPGQRWILTEEEMKQDLPKLQLDILHQAARIVKKGGILIYATCSISYFENERVAFEFENSLNFNDEWVNWNFEELLNPKRKSDKLQMHSFPCEQNKRYVGKNWRSILPHLHDADGFFIARWKRRL